MQSQQPSQSMSLGWQHLTETCRQHAACQPQHSLLIAHRAPHSRLQLLLLLLLLALKPAA
jgi:hypothetical protein